MRRLDLLLLLGLGRHMVGSDQLLQTSLGPGLHLGLMGLGLGLHLGLMGLGLGLQLGLTGPDMLPGLGLQLGLTGLDSTVGLGLHLGLMGLGLGLEVPDPALTDLDVPESGLDLLEPGLGHDTGLGLKGLGLTGLGLTGLGLTVMMDMSRNGHVDTGQ